MVEDYEILEPNMRKLTHTDFYLMLLNVADCCETHHFFKDNWQMFVPGPAQFRAHAAKSKELNVGAERGDREMKAQRDEHRELAQLDIDVAVKYMVIRAVEQRDPTLLHGTGIPLKEIKRPRISAKALLEYSLPIALTVGYRKNPVGFDSGVAVLKGKHVRRGGPYLLQICKGEPVSEESWYSPGGHYKSCREIVLTNLEPANKYCFRIRTDGPEGPGPWSQVVSLIIL